MKMLIASDHAGYDLKETLKGSFSDFTWIDLGPDSKDSVDYPDYAHKLANALMEGQADLGVLICGSGIGISMAANRHKGVRAALCTNGLMARLSRQHNNANVLVLGERLTGIDVAKDCLDEFLKTEFEGGRHERRVNKIEC
ncbi:MAG: ribose 5-phosphate isomerase B [Micavibrio sp.]|nr:ribose 5-phosphate isomerase B [Micavibrio sp.]